MPELRPSRRSWLGGCLATAWAAPCVAASAALAPGRWPHWRGPAQSGAAPDRRVPAFWGEQSTVLWKCPLPPWGVSTPIVWNDALFVTAQDAGNQLRLLRIDAGTGRAVWNQVVGRAATPRGPVQDCQLGRPKDPLFDRRHNLASPSPVTDGRYVVAHFGNGDLAAFDFQGKRLWMRNLQADHGTYTVAYGHASSPLIHNGLVITACVQTATGGGPGSYLVAHDLRDGHRKWMTPRPQETGGRLVGGTAADSYASPILMRHRASMQVVVLGPQCLDAYDPVNGRRVWWLPDLRGKRVIASPVSGQGLVFVCVGGGRSLLAVRPGEGKLDRRNLAWSYRRGAADASTPALWDRLLFLISNDGLARCVDALSGNLKWKKQLLGEYLASPVAVDGRVFFMNTEGACTVVSATSRFDRLTVNEVEDTVLASPLVAGGRLFLRGRHKLYCVGHLPEERKRGQEPF